TFCAFSCIFSYMFFFFNDPSPSDIYTLSLHDALPISIPGPGIGYKDLHCRFVKMTLWLAHGLSQPAEQMTRDNGNVLPTLAKRRSEERRVGKECRARG